MSERRARQPRNLVRLLADCASGGRPTAGEALSLLAEAPLEALQPVAESLALEGHGRTVSYSRKVFVPLTRLCRDVCHYCTFAQAPRHLPTPYLSIRQVLEIVRAGEAQSCKEALFTLGDKPELRYAAAREALAGFGYARTVDYLEAAARAVLRETTLLPHLNSGVMSEDDLRLLKPVAASMGLMLESAAERLCERGGPHHGSPDKRPSLRLATLHAAGRLGIPFTSGILIGIGETRRERLESLLALRDLHDEFGHLQDLIIQNFCAKPGTAMARSPEPSLEEQLWTIAAARLLFGPSMSIQAPPNLRPGALERLAVSGINDWGGVSPVTPDHVNPEAPWPELEALERMTRAAGRELVERLAITPAYAREPSRWLDADLAVRVRRFTDATGHARSDAWFAGVACEVPKPVRPGRGRPAARGAVARALRAAAAGRELAEAEVVALLTARADDHEAVLRAADRLRRERVGDAASYVVNRNINYTNICTYSCGFCAFSKGRSADSLRGPGYLLDLDEVVRRAVEARQCGATEVCLQGGIHPSFTGRTYLDIVAAIKAAVPEIHVHAFSPLEVQHGAATLGLPLEDYLHGLKRAGLASLPGTAAEILDDEVRAVICPDKLDTAGWLEVMRCAHRVGLSSTATMMFGHVDGVQHWARHLLRVRALQEETGGFTEFVPLPFVHTEAPLWRKGLARSGPTFREAVLVHAVARLVLHPVIGHIQASWVKMGLEGLEACLNAGADDMGGVLMNESITRAAGGAHGQEMPAATLEDFARRMGRRPWQRTTLYRPATLRAGHESTYRPTAGDSR
ncbi:MAG: 5-amino-6-(D-ribitylamino)uracil--L-tyrosine 4-hydroxyphenyl transferase CofH [Steroidobacteraceae bacterium]|jgi:FO synthase|nr:5-amino-6-(D-ribitylamino)uracil--L-tyrosine 4-hydroxyphenyl transferase CofH [Steroidobacteraceae bacterium]